MSNFIMIRASYSQSSFKLSDRRLEISKVTCIPSLRYQTNKDFTVVLTVNRTDPLLYERIKLFEDVCPSIRIATDSVEFKTHTYNEGWKTVSRMDDDDMISDDYINNVVMSSKKSELFLCHPYGYLYFEGELFRIRYIGNMFPTLLTNQNITPFDEFHGRYPDIYHKRIVNVSRKQGWVWVRHNNALSNSNKNGKLSGLARKWITYPPERKKPLYFTQDWDNVKHVVSKKTNRYVDD